MNKSTQCLKVAKEIKLKYLLHEFFDFTSIPRELVKEAGFKSLYQVVAIPVFLILILMGLLEDKVTIIIKIWQVIRQPLKISTEGNTIANLWSLSDDGSHFPNAVELEILDQWLVILYNGWVNIDLEEQLNTIFANRREFSKKHGHIVWGEPPISTAVRKVSNTLPYYA